MNDTRLARAKAVAPGMRESDLELARGFFGVAGLDELLPEGVPYSSQIMATGDTGVGKTILAAQFLYEGLLVGDHCIYVACDESPNVMRVNMANLRLGTVAYERAGRLLFIDAFGRERSRERVVIHDPRNLDEFFAHEREAVERFGTARVRLVVDSISTIFGAHERTSILEFNRNRLRYLGARQVMVLDNYVTGLLEEPVLAGLSHAYPLMVRLGYRTEGEQMQRFLQLGKLRSGMFSGERRVFRVDPRAGIVVQR